MKLFIFLIAYLFTFSAYAQLQVPLNNSTWKVPFVAISSSDHITEKTDASSITCRRSKNGTDAACAGSATELSDANNPGQWEYSLAAGDTDTAGPVSFRFSATGMDPARVLIQVGGVNIVSGGIAAASFASGAIDATAIASNALTASKFAAQGTAQSSGASTLTLASGETYGDNAPVGSMLYIASASTGVGQTRRITGYVNSTKVATVDSAWSPSLSGTITYNVIADSSSVTDKSGYSLASSQTFNMTGNITGNVTGSVGSVTGSVGSVTGSVGSVTGSVGGNVTGSVGSVLTVSDDSLNGNVAAIKAKTDQLQFTTANQVSARINYVGGNAVSSPLDFSISVADILNTNVEDWPTGLGKYIDTIKKYVANRLVISSNSYTVYKDNGTTTFQTGTSSAGNRAPN